jgi:hypothetical protein
LRFPDTLFPLSAVSSRADLDVDYPQVRSCSQQFVVRLDRGADVRFCPENAIGVDSSAAFVFAGLLMCPAPEPAICVRAYGLQDGLFAKKVVVKITKTAALEDRNFNGHFFPKSSPVDEATALRILHDAPHTPSFFGVGLLEPRLPAAVDKAIVMDHVGEWTLLQYLTRTWQFLEDAAVANNIYQWVGQEIFDIIDEQALLGVVHGDLHFDNLILSTRPVEDPAADSVSPALGRINRPPKFPAEVKTLKAIDFNLVVIGDVDAVTKLLAVGKAAVRLDRWGLGVMPNAANRERLQKFASQAADGLRQRQINKVAFFTMVNADVHPKEAHKTFPSPESWLGSLLAFIPCT